MGVHSPGLLFLFLRFICVNCSGLQFRYCFALWFGWVNVSGLFRYCFVFTGFTVPGQGRRSPVSFCIFYISYELLFTWMHCDVLLFFWLFRFIWVYCSGFKIWLLFQFYSLCGLNFSVYLSVVLFSWLYRSGLVGVVVFVYLGYCFG